MSWNPALDPHCPTGAGIDAIETLGTRRIRWNVVASSRGRIEAAKEAWRQADWRGRFQLPPDDADFIPLPEPAARR